MRRGLQSSCYRSGLFRTPSASASDAGTAHAAAFSLRIDAAWRPTAADWPLFHLIGAALRGRVWRVPAPWQMPRCVSDPRWQGCICRRVSPPGRSASRTADGGPPPFHFCGVAGDGGGCGSVCGAGAAARCAGATVRSARCATVVAMRTSSLPNLYRETEELRLPNGVVIVFSHLLGRRWLATVASVVLIANLTDRFVGVDFSFLLLLRMQLSYVDSSSCFQLVSGNI